MDISKLKTESLDYEKTTYLNIDSSKRNYYPENVIESNLISLESNPITVTQDSSEVKIEIKNNNYAIGDKILIQNVEGYKKKLLSAITFINNFNYCVVNFSNHNLNENYLKYNDDFKISLSILDELDTSDRLIENIPLNSIVGVKKIYYPGDTNLTLSVDLVTVLSITEEDLNSNYFLIELPFDFISLSSTLTFDKIVEIKFLNIGNIYYSYLNSNYPIDYNQYQGYQEITKVETDYIYINTKVKSYVTLTSGGDYINISKITRIIEGFPYADDYTIQLKNNYTNIISIDLVSSEIPFVDLVVKSSGTKQNNKLYWKHLDDGDNIYSIELDEGNYNSSYLEEELLGKINKVERIGSTEKNPIYNLFEFEIGIIKKKITNQDLRILAFQKIPLPNSIAATTVTIDGVQFYKLTVTHTNNYLEVNDIIIIENCLQIGQVPEDQINTTHKIYEVNRSTGTYSFLINYANLESTSVSGNGGEDIVIKMKALVSFLFDKPDTIGEVLGFKDVGFKNAITNFSHITSNSDDYMYTNNLDSVGNLDINKNLITLRSKYNYMLMYLNDYENIVSNGISCFAKIQLCGDINKVLFNKHVCRNFEYPIDTLNELRVVFKYPDGSRVNFRNMENSFTLKIVEQITSNNLIGINSKMTSYNDTIKDLDL